MKSLRSLLFIIGLAATGLAFTNGCAKSAKAPVAPTDTTEEADDSAGVQPDGDDTDKASGPEGEDTSW